MALINPKNGMTLRPIPTAQEPRWVGSVWAMAQDAPGFLLRLAQTYGPVTRFSALGTPLLLVVQPDLVHEILVTQVDRFPKAERDVEILGKVLGTGLLINNGASHRQRRRLIQPAFHMKRVHAYAETMVDYTEAMLDRWQDGAVYDMSEAMMQLTLFIVTKSLFGADRSAMNDLAAQIDAAVRRLQEGAKFNFNFGAVIPNWAPTPAKRKAQAARRTLDQVVDHIISRHRRQSPTELAARADLLAMLLLAEDEAGNRLDDAAVRDEVITLFLAGHETTSNTLTWVAYLLTQYPDVQTRLQDEVDAALADAPLALETLPRLPYTLMIIKEAMRLYPPAWALNGRQALEDTRVGDYLIPKGTIVLLSPYVQHRLAEYFPSPDTFDPTRFAPEREKALPKHVYMPFGAGPRICIGNSFAMLEAQLILAAMARRFAFSLPTGQVVEPFAQITLAPKDGLPLRVHARRHTPHLT